MSPDQVWPKNVNIPPVNSIVYSTVDWGPTSLMFWTVNPDASQSWEQTVPSESAHLPILQVIPGCRRLRPPPGFSIWKRRQYNDRNNKENYRWFRILIIFDRRFPPEGKRNSHVSLTLISRFIFFCSAFVKWEFSLMIYPLFITASQKPTAGWHSSLIFLFGLQSNMYLS